MNNRNLTRRRLFTSAFAGIAAAVGVTLKADNASAGPLVTRGEVRRTSRRTSRRTARRTTRRINTLPPGYRTVYMYGAPYYYAAGRYYQPYGNVYVEVEFD